MVGPTAVNGQTFLPGCGYDGGGKPVNHVLPTAAQIDVEGWLCMQSQWRVYSDDRAVHVLTAKHVMFSNTICCDMKEDKRQQL